MDTIKIIINIDGEIKICGEHTATGPFELAWFPGNGLVLEHGGKRAVINTDNTKAGGVYKITKDIFTST